MVSNSMGLCKLGKVIIYSMKGIQAQYKDLKLYIYKKKKNHKKRIEENVMKIGKTEPKNISGNWIKDYFNTKNWSNLSNKSNIAKKSSKIKNEKCPCIWQPEGISNFSKNRGQMELE